jgi:hypothetical protein
MYKIRDADGDIYTFKNAEELLKGLTEALGSEHQYYWNGEWYEV